MAASDYRLCDHCGRKAFYDSNLNYDIGGENERRDEDGQLLPDYVGSWAVICEDCAKTHVCKVVPR